MQVHTYVVARRRVNPMLLLPITGPLCAFPFPACSLVQWIFALDINSLCWNYEIWKLVKHECSLCCVMSHTKQDDGLECIAKNLSTEFWRDVHEMSRRVVKVRFLLHLLLSPIGMDLGLLHFLFRSLPG